MRDRRLRQVQHTALGIEKGGRISRSPPLSFSDNETEKSQRGRNNLRIRINSLSKPSCTCYQSSFFKSAFITSVPKIKTPVSPYFLSQQISTFLPPFLAWANVYLPSLPNFFLTIPMTFFTPTRGGIPTWDFPLLFRPRVDFPFCQLTPCLCAKFNDS